MTCKPKALRGKVPYGQTKARESSKIGFWTLCKTGPQKRHDHGPLSCVLDAFRSKRVFFPVLKGCSFCVQVLKSLENFAVKVTSRGSGCHILKMFDEDWGHQMASEGVNMIECDPA